MVIAISERSNMAKSNGNHKFPQQEFNQFIIEEGIIGFFPKPIKLVSGRISNWYVNWRNIVEDVYLIDQLSDYLLQFVQANKLDFDCFFGTPDGATKLAVISQYKWAKQQPEFGQRKYVLPMGRKVPKDHGEEKDRYFVGAPAGKIIVLEDVTTTGGSLLKTVASLREMKFEVVAAIALTNRNEVMDDQRHVADALADLSVKYLAMSEAVQLLPIALNRIKEPIMQEFKQYGQKPIEF